jgi:hypothetical protein
VTPVSSQLLRYRDGHGDDWADITGKLTMHPDSRGQVARMLGGDRSGRVGLFRVPG